MNSIVKFADIRSTLAVVAVLTCEMIIAIYAIHGKNGTKMEEKHSATTS